MSRVQQEVVIRKKDVKITDCVFLGKPVYVSDKFGYTLPKKLYKRRRNKRLIKKWCKRYGYYFIPREDAVIYPHGIVCHPDTLWRFKEKFINPEGAEIPEDDHDIHL